MEKSQEYLKALRERHDMRRKTTMHKSFKRGDIVLINGENKNRGKWNMGIVTKLFQGNHVEIRAVELRAGKDKLKKAIQHLFSCNINRYTDDQVNVNVIEFWPKRNAAAVADLQLRYQAAIEQEKPYLE